MLTSTSLYPRSTSAVWRSMVRGCAAGGRRAQHTLARPNAGPHTPAWRVCSTAATQGTASQHENNPKILEEEKHKALHDETTPTNPDHPNWNEKLASTAEAVVKAEGIDMPIEELQDFTIKSLHGTPEEHASMKEEDLKDN